MQSDGGSGPQVPGYRDLRRLAAGGFSTVYAARQESFARTVAIKVINADPENARDNRRFLRECRAAGMVSHHPNIVTVLDAGTTSDGLPYIVMEYLPAGSLADRIRDDGPLSVQATLRIGGDVANALEEALDSGILHCDVKPGNILLTDAGSGVLGDFGIARILHADEGSTSGTSLTPVHSAPELLDGEPHSAASDVYALGSTLHTMLAGTPPYAARGGEGISSVLRRVGAGDLTPLVRDDVPQELSRLISRAMSADPAERPDVATVRRELDRLARDGGTSAAARYEMTEPPDPSTVIRPNPSPPIEPAAPAAPPPEPRPADRRVRVALVAAAVVALLVGGGLLLVNRLDGGSPSRAAPAVPGVAMLTDAAGVVRPVASGTPLPTDVTTTGSTPSGSMTPTAPDSHPSTPPRPPTGITLNASARLIGEGPNVRIAAAATTADGSAAAFTIVVDPALSTGETMVGGRTTGSAAGWTATLTGCRKHTFTVRATGDSATRSVPAPVAGCEIPAAPTGLSIVAGPTLNGVTTVKVSWDAATAPSTMYAYNLICNWPACPIGTFSTDETSFTQSVQSVTLCSSGVGTQPPSPTDLEVVTHVRAENPAGSSLPTTAVLTLTCPKPVVPVPPVPSAK